MKIPRFECCLADVCLPDYWCGHHRPHITIPVWNGMTLKEIKEALKQEIMQGAIAGSDRDSYLLASDFIKPEEEKEADRLVRAAYAAINRLRPVKKGQRRFFLDLEKENDSEVYDISVYAYFVFMPLD